MPMPQEYQIAAQDYDAFINDARQALDLETRNQVYTVVEAVFVTFRRRLEANDVLAFASALPALLRAIFVANWDPADRTDRFGTPADWAREVRSLRRHHNFAPEDAVSILAGVLRRHVDTGRFDKMLDGLSPEARKYWKV